MAKISAWVTRVYEDQGHDPEIDNFTSVFGKERIKESDLAALAGLSPSTVKNLVGGQTRRPQHTTFAKMAAAMGYKYGLERDEKPDYESAIPEAREQYREHKAQLAKARGQTGKKKKKVKKIYA
jgi:transcriptional regulator with XRE-family HTH domain